MNMCMSPEPRTEENHTAGLGFVTKYHRARVCNYGSLETQPDVVVDDDNDDDSSVTASRQFIARVFWCEQAILC